MYIRILKPLEIRKEKEELTFKSQESTNCQKAESRHPGSATDDGIKCDDIIASSNSDVTIRDTLWNAGVNRLIARKLFVPRKRSLTYSVGSFKRSLRACIRIITIVMLFVAITTSMLGGLINNRRCERKSTVGTSASLPRFESSRSYSCYSSLSILRKFLANILGSDKELWPCVIIDTNWKDNKRLKRRKEILQKSRNTRIFRPVTALAWLRNLRFGNVAKETFCLRSGNVAKETFLAGKCLSAYLCLFADFWASHLCGLDTYTGNLELNDNFKIFYGHIYLYIYDVYRSWVSYNWATYPEAFSVKTYTLVYFSSKASLLMIKSHDKYQSIVLIGLAHVEKAYSEIRSISVHNRSHWRELRPLVTPWAWCIKEGIEPWRFQKRFIPSHVQVSLLPLSLSSPSLALFCFCCFIIIIIIYYYVYLLVKGIITVENKPGPKYSNDQGYKPGYLNSKDTLTLSLSLSLPKWPLCVCRLSHTYNIASWARCIT